MKITTITYLLTLKSATGWITPTPTITTTPTTTTTTTSTTNLHSTTEETEETTTTTTTMKKTPPTRFDTLKTRYKGPRRTLSDADSPFSYSEFDEAVRNTNYAFNRNDIVRGTVVQYDNGGCIVDIGAKASAFLPLGEASLIQDKKQKQQQQGGGGGGGVMLIEDLVPLDTERDFQIISEENEEGQLLLSIKRIEYAEAWSRVEALSEKDEGAFEAEVVAVNRGGAICLVEGLRAFLPGSHLAGQLPTEDLIGQMVPLKFLEVNREENKLVVSNRRAVVETQMAELSRGDLVDGMVKALKPYGAFVEVGGMSGLLHISQISYDRIDDLESVLQPGMAVKCMIIDHDKVNGRIALSTKTLEPEPGDMIKDAAAVFEKAEETAAKYHERMEAERKAREEAARDIVLGLGDSLDDLDDDDEDGDGSAEDEGDDPLAEVSDNLDSLLS